MSRYIDADAFLENNKEFADRELEHPRYQETLRELIDDAPSIDIVRCGECKWYNCGACFRDDGVNNSRNVDDFCSYGSSSEKPNNSKVSEIQTGSERSSE